VGKGALRAVPTVDPDPKIMVGTLRFAHPTIRFASFAMTAREKSVFSFSCGRAVDERDVALTQAAANLRVVFEKRCTATCGAS
jgi:hypothetical protein